MKEREFVHLHCHSPYSFLDGASPIESLTAKAAMWGMSALALTDSNTIAGLPEFHKWAASYGIKPISGSEVTLTDGTHLTLLAENKTGYTHLCQLLTLAHEGEDGRLDPKLSERDLFANSEGLIVLSGCRKGRIAQHLLNYQPDAALAVAKKYQAVFPGSYFLELQGDAYPRTNWLNSQLAELSRHTHIPMAGTSNVHHVNPADSPVYDALKCISCDTDVYTPHPNRPLNTTRYLHSKEEAYNRFAEYPEAVSSTQAIAQRCQVVLSLGASLFPKYKLPSKEFSAMDYFRRLVYNGAKQRYGSLTNEIKERLEYEFSIILQLGYVDYFLVVWDIVRFARQNRIRCAGRGSAADSAVAYCLFITDVDAVGRNLLFERFMSLERAERPDIDIDFDSRRRDEVIDYVYRKYGRDYVARIATLQTFRGRSAIREFGKALGVPQRILDVVAKRVPAMAHADDLAEMFDRIPEMQELKQYQKQLSWIWKLAEKAAGFPRHFGMHVGGVVISSRPLYEVTSLQPSAKGEWMTPFDKHAVEDVGLVKLDLLSLRTMSAIEDTIVQSERQGRAVDYDSIPLDDKATFAMIGRSDTVGVFQLESPAQRALQARLESSGLEDLVASVALIRPGPIQGNMVDPFIRRRRGLEPISYLHPKLEPILAKTYGVVLFQEQVIEIATVIAQFSPGEADELRRVMSKARTRAEMDRIGDRFLKKARQAGVDEAAADTIFSYIKGYASYGFCEAHAAAFAATSYKTAYLSRHYPAEFFASILNQQPMGYYPVHVVCAAARQRGIAVIGPDINRSEWECTVKKNQIQLGFCLIKGIRQSLVQKIVSERQQHGGFESAPDCISRVHDLDRLSAEKLIRVGSFDGVSNVPRQSQLWELPHWFARRMNHLPLLRHESVQQKPLEITSKAIIRNDRQKYRNTFDDAAKERQLLAGQLSDEYNLVGVGVSGHWLDLFRPHLKTEGYAEAKDVIHCPDNAQIKLAGIVVRPHRPPTRSGRTTVFFTLEDETGFADATMFENVYQATGSIIFTPYGRLIGMEGTVQYRESQRPQLIVSRVWALTSDK
ncbi:DNA polymerase III subunit alpha [Alicyclobacillus sp. SO9]|uniref:DNA polymerase III subunit alpha n=1 Tax=Alicyclobacillus sp. SO9 TaxID=2665646 RepID=UPI0018E8D375|nr:DNA polymerase III subunit alpha [Alicyclobacillus sp. SO9]QQE80337.1 DNA polymerase III subunit alpha [Alicyclobacillus sp. SO9]